MSAGTRPGRVALAALAVALALGVAAMTGILFPGQRRSIGAGEARCRPGMADSAACARPAQASRALSGEVKLVKDARTEFDPYDTRANEGWINANFYRMTGYSPAFDSRLSWYRRARAYVDAYAIEKDSPLAREHPDWILTDSRGERLYVPWQCEGGTCQKWAGDISNPGFRAHWIQELKRTLIKGYDGVFIDNVNVALATSNGRGEITAPLDRSTGMPMTSASWGAYFAGFMTEVRRALPGVEITHNEQVSDGSPASDPYVARAVSQANWNDLEFGLDASWLTGGTGASSVYGLLAYVDAVHALGSSVDIAGAGSTVAQMQLTLAGYLLVNNGSDLLTVPGAEGLGLRLWRGWSVNLGEALGPRSRTPAGLFQRSFSGGVVYLNEPGAPPATITLAMPMIDVEGRTVSSLTLGERSGAVLRNRGG